MFCLLTILVVAATVSLGQGAVRWTEDLQSTKISEYSIPDDYIGTLLAYDTDDPPRIFSYGIYDIDDADIPPNYVDAFDYLKVDATSGIVTVKAPMDYEKFEQMTAQWEADTVRTTVDLFISNENNNSPEFQDEPYSAEVSVVYLMTEVDQVSAIFGDEPVNVRKTQDDFKRLLEEIIEQGGGYSNVSANIDSIAYKLDANCLGIPNRTEMLLHVVDDVKKTVISPSEILAIIDHAYGYTEELLSYHLLEVELKTKHVEPDVLSALQIASFSLAFVMFLLLVLTLVAFYWTVASYRRKIRALERFDTVVGQVARAPDNNKYAENKNPIYTLKATDVREPLYSDVDEAGNQAAESPGRREEEFEEVEIDFDAEPNNETIEGNDQLLQEVLDRYERNAGVNLDFDPGELNQNMYMCDV